MCISLVLVYIAYSSEFEKANNNPDVQNLLDSFHLTASEIPVGFQKPGDFELRLAHHLGIETIHS